MKLIIIVKYTVKLNDIIIFLSLQIIYNLDFVEKYNWVLRT